MIKMRLPLLIQKTSDLLLEKIALIIFREKIRKIGKIDFKKKQISKIHFPKKYRHSKYNDFCIFITSDKKDVTFDFIVDNNLLDVRFCCVKSASLEDKSFHVKAWTGDKAVLLKPVIMQANRSGFRIPDPHSIEKITHIEICSDIDFNLTVSLETVRK